MSTTINEAINKKISDFKDVLESISSLADKRRTLWLDVYTNALQDRDFALQMYTHLSVFVAGDPNQHALHGPNIAKYLERMSKANDQLLKLAELVHAAAAAAEEAEVMTSDELYDKLNDPDPVVKIGSRR